MKKEDIKLKIDYLRNKLDKLKKSISRLENIKGSDFELEYIILRAIERDSEEIIEISTKINQELLSLKNEVAMSYRESFEKLIDLNIFNLKEDKELLEKLANSTGFRNRLAHDYMNLDNKITINSAKQIIKIYPKYLLRIIDFIENI
jgi:uncharacterized protein YutE (UPF0331/DUF86 family)